MEENESELVRDGKQPPKLLVYTLLAIGFVWAVFELKKCDGSSDSSTSSYSEKSKEKSICDCENAYRAVMYGEGTHSENKYTGEKYKTLDANGNSYIDVIDECARIYGGKPLSDGGFSNYPAYQDCIRNKNEPTSVTSPDTLIANWNPENYHILELDKIGGYLYGSPWNPMGFVMVFKAMEEDRYGNRTVKKIINGHYKVSKKFQLEAKKYSSANYYRWETWTSDDPGTFGTFVECIENHNFNQNKTCDCSNLLPD